MKFTEAISKCYRKYAKFKGRASRSEYWWFQMLCIAFAWPLLLTELETGFWYSVMSLVYFLLTVSAIIPSLAVWTRRMHDVNKSGWSWLWLLLPVIGWILIFKRLVKPGDSGRNKYGDPDNDLFTPVEVRTQSVNPKVEAISNE